MNDEKNEIARKIADFRSDLNKVRLEGTEADIDAVEAEFADFLVTASKNDGFAKAQKIANDFYKTHFSELLSEFFYSNLIPFSEDDFDAEFFIYDDRFDFVFTDDRDIESKVKTLVIEEVVGHYSRMKDYYETSKVRLQEEIKLVDEDIASVDEQIKAIRNIKLS